MNLQFKWIIFSGKRKHFSKKKLLRHCCFGANIREAFHSAIDCEIRGDPNTDDPADAGKFIPELLEDLVDQFKG